MKVSIVHSCFNQHLNEKRPKTCRCRKHITLIEATRMVEKGFAQWLITSSQTSTVKEICRICANGDLKKGCQHCLGLGEVEKKYQIPVLSVHVVLVTATSDADSEPVYRSVKAKQTPRVATIEKPHIERAYCDGVTEEQERIDIYGLMTLEARINMGNGETVIPIGIEPPDDPSTGTGRTYDTGRSPFARISDERTTLGVGKVGARILEGFKQMRPNGKDGEEE